MDEKVTHWLTFAARLTIGGLFLVTGVLKMLDPSEFLKAIENYKILPHLLAITAVFYLPFLEIFCGISLIVKRFYAGALALLTGLMLVFIVALISAWARGLDIDCGCFGSAEGPAHYGLALTRDFAILATLCFLGWHSGSKSTWKAR